MEENKRINKMKRNSDEMANNVNLTNTSFVNLHSDNLVMLNLFSISPKRYCNFLFHFINNIIHEFQQWN